MKEKSSHIDALSRKITETQTASSCDVKAESILQKQTEKTLKRSKMKKRKNDLKKAAPLTSRTSGLAVKTVTVVLPAVLLLFSAWGRDWSRSGISYALWGFSLGTYTVMLLYFYLVARDA